MIQLTRCILLANIVLLGACDFLQSGFSPESKVEIETNPDKNIEAWPTLTLAIECLSKTGPFISMHRARDKAGQDADNSISGLQYARSEGYIMAEIDVAELKDGTYILFHDDEWDQDSTGRGGVVRSTYKQSQTYWLKNHRGKITADKPLSLERALSFADQRLYLEIDFKSANSQANIIKQIRAANMAGYVALIAYSHSQALSLAKLAPDMMIAAPIHTFSDIDNYTKKGLPKDRLIIWLGTEDYNEDLAARLKQDGIASAYGMFSPKYARQANYEEASIIVSDFPDEALDKLTGRARGQDRLKKCG